MGPEQDLDGHHLGGSTPSPSHHTAYCRRHPITTQVLPLDRRPPPPMDVADTWAGSAPPARGAPKVPLPPPLPPSRVPPRLTPQPTLPPL